MPWRPLSTFADPALPKLGNLRRAREAGLAVPTTVWAPATELDAGASLAPPEAISGPCIVRSASPTEDTDAGTAAGQFVSVAVTEPGALADGGGTAFAAAVRRVVASLPRDGAGRPRGAAFVQPLLTPERGGVAFFDGFYFERTTAAGGNQALTSGTERGDVVRGHLRRAEPWSDWLRHLDRAFRDELGSGLALDVEFAQGGDRFTLLQARPARFGVRRNPLLSLANHREILGDPPSPWIVAALEEAGGDALAYFAEVDPAVREWNERYSQTVGGRAWLNFSFFYRLMDRWGLPRSFVTEGVGGSSEGPADARPDLSRMVRMSPRLVALQLKNLRTVAGSGAPLAELGRRIEEARDLCALFDATVFGLGVALRTNFAINGALTGAVRVRRALGLRGRARVTTEAMMEDYDALRAVEPERRETALDAWLEAYGHRGPLESDPSRPRFRELRDVLLADLERGAAGTSAAIAPSTIATTRADHGPSAPVGRGPLYAMDRRREAFRDDLMRHWQRLRERILEQAVRWVDAGRLERAGDVFLLDREDLRPDAPLPDLAARRAEHERLARIQLPTTATRDAIEACLAGAGRATGSATAGATAGPFPGIALSRAVFEGTVQRADDLVTLLERERESGRPLLDLNTVLVVPALEPSWAVVFGRVGAVVTELGGELSHASILLREAGKPALVNCEGVYDALEDGARVRLDGEAALLTRLSTPN